MSLVIIAVLSVAAMVGMWRFSKWLDKKNARRMRESDKRWAKALKKMDGGTGALSAWIPEDKDG